MTLGSLGILCTAARCMIGYAIRHFIVDLALSIKHHCDAWKSFIKRPDSMRNSPMLEETQRERLENVWIYYFEIRRTSQLINKYFGVAMKFIHVSNMLELAYFVAQVVQSEHTTITFFLSLYEVGLILLFSFIASRVSSVVRKSFT